jgi:hypothetical protein
MSEQNNVLNGVEIIRDGNEMIVNIPLKMTEAKLEVLVEVAKAWNVDLAEVIEDAIDRDIRALLEGGNDVGDALNKKLCNTWLKEIGEEGTKDGQRHCSRSTQYRRC